MKSFVFLSLLLAFAPASAQAQAAPASAGTQNTGPTAGQRAAMQQLRLEVEQYRQQTRTRMLAALTPQHRSAVANVVGQLALSPNPNRQAAAQSLDAILFPAEKQTILSVEATQRANLRALRQQRRAAFAATLTADQRARMEQREAAMQAFRQSHPRPAPAADPGAIVLRTLADIGGPGMRAHAF